MYFDAASAFENAVIESEERKSLYDRYFEREHEVVTGTVSRIAGKNIIVNLDHVDASLSENEQTEE